jgi:hypothetical protein
LSPTSDLAEDGVWIGVSIGSRGRHRRAGDPAVRVALFEVAHVLLTQVSPWSTIKTWPMQIARRRGAKRTKVALARKLAVVIHRMWRDGTAFQFGARLGAEVSVAGDLRISRDQLDPSASVRAGPMVGTKPPDTSRRPGGDSTFEIGSPITPTASCEVDAGDPELDVAFAGEVARLPGGQFGPPRLLQSADGRGGQAGRVRPEQHGERFAEVAA